MPSCRYEKFHNFPETRGNNTPRFFISRSEQILCFPGFNVAISGFKNTFQSIQNGQNLNLKHWNPPFNFTIIICEKTREHAPEKSQIH